MRIFFILLLLIIFMSGCIQSGEKKISEVGLSATLTSAKKVPATMPTTFILTMKNLASEDAENIKVHLTNLTNWQVEKELQELKVLRPNDLYKFSWVAYSPSQNKTFTPVANIFYFMSTKANLKLRVYDNDYLNTLKPEESKKIKEKSAVIYFNSSKNAPVKLNVNVQQPFILTKYIETFPFVLEIENVGSGEVYTDFSNYPPFERDKGYLRFEFATTSTLNCDFRDGELIKISNKNKSIVCRLIVNKDDIQNYTDFQVNFLLSYTYLDKVKGKIEVI
ncbi:MAG: hypothetical protein QW228_02260 [Candidatus Aenigmatarchaeota archaeon]